jgi:hypothetical protein
VNKRDTHGRSALLLSCKFGQVTVWPSCYKRHLLINKPLSAKQADCCEILLAHGAKYFADKYFYTQQTKIKTHKH